MLTQKEDWQGAANQSFFCYDNNTDLNSLRHVFPWHGSHHSLALSVQGHTLQVENVSPEWSPTSTSTILGQISEVLTGLYLLLMAISFQSSVLWQPSVSNWCTQGKWCYRLSYNCSHAHSKHCFFVVVYPFIIDREARDTFGSVCPSIYNQSRAKCNQKIEMNRHGSSCMTQSDYLLYNDHVITWESLW